MKQVRFISTGVLLLLGAIAPTYANQDQHQQESKAPQQEQQAKPQAQAKQPQQHAEQQAKPQAQAKQPQQHAEQQAKPQAQAKQPQQHAQQQAKPQAQAKQPQQHAEQQAKPQAQAKQPQQQQVKGQQEQQGQQRVQRSTAEVQKQRSEPALRLSVRSETRIPDDRFRSNFGPSHRFRIGSPRMVDGYSRFQYGGFWFGFLDPWPEGWFYTDNVYVDYIDGEYYLCNPYYPGVHIAITVYAG